MGKCFGIVFSLAVMSSAAAAYAQDPPPMPPGGVGGGTVVQFRGQLPSFADLDKNKDKKISKEEWASSQFPPQMFDRLDTNNDGFIDEEEFKSIRRGFGGGGGMGPRTGESLIKLLDANGDGKISREEFAKIVSLFDALDKDHNGELSAEELNGFMRAVNEAQAQATGGVELNNLFERYDKNKDGKITPDELTDQRIFRSLDLNKDGVITREEADTALKQLKKAADAKKAAEAKKAQPPNN